MFPWGTTVKDILKWFMPCNGKVIVLRLSNLMFPVVSHRSIYLSVYPLLSPDDFKCPVKEEVTITSGEWEVLANHGSKVKPCPHICSRLLTFNCFQSSTNFPATTTHQYTDWIINYIWDALHDVQYISVSKAITWAQLTVLGFVLQGSCIEKFNKLYFQVNLENAQKQCDNWTEPVTTYFSVELWLITYS